MPFLQRLGVKKTTSFWILFWHILTTLNERKTNWPRVDITCIIYIYIHILRSLQQIRKFKWKIKYWTAFRNLPFRIPIPWRIYMGILTKKNNPHRPQRPFLCHRCPGSSGRVGRPGPGGGRPTSAAWRQSGRGIGSVLSVGIWREQLEYWSQCGLHIFSYTKHIVL